jgi:hypothetical protein
MKEVAELLAQKELEVNNLSRQIESISKEMDALRTTLRLLEESGSAKPPAQEPVKRPAASVRSEAGQSSSRESAVVELP